MTDEEQAVVAVKGSAFEDDVEMAPAPESSNSHSDMDYLKDTNSVEKKDLDTLSDERDSHDDFNPIDDDFVEDDEEEDDMKGPVRTRKDRPTRSTHYGDVDFFEEEADEIGEATWSEVCQSCFVHTPKEWLFIVMGTILALIFLYFFLFGLDLLGNGAKVLTSCVAGSLFDTDTNPVAAAVIGILATVLLQSSSTTTSIIVSLVGVGTLAVQPAIYMVMGANIGTSVTNTIVALGQMGDGDQLERAFAGATVHDMFNYLTVVILLPLEVVSQYLYRLTTAITASATVKDGSDWDGPIKKLVDPLTDLLIIPNSSVAKAVAANTASCDDYYPTYCAGAPSNGGALTYETCADTTKYPDSRVGLITCNKSTGRCPLFFQNNASRGDDKASGAVAIILGLLILFLSLMCLIRILQRLLMDVSTRIIYKATNVNGYLAMLIGCGVTIIVQSSSVTTSVLTPLVGMGVLQLEQMYPLTLGANLGTTVTALLAASVSDSIESLQVALAHLFFNISGIIIWYPIPFMRRVPMRGARTLGKGTRWWRGFPILYIAVVFFLGPLLLLGISELFTLDSKGYTVLGSLLVIVIGVGIIYFSVWWTRLGGKTKTKLCFRARERKRRMNTTLADDMDYLKNNMARVMEQLGITDDDDSDDDHED